MASRVNASSLSACVRFIDSSIVCFKGFVTISVVSSLDRRVPHDIPFVV